VVLQEERFILAIIGVAQNQHRVESRRRRVEINRRYQQIMHLDYLITVVHAPIVYLVYEITFSLLVVI
jgi:hypothetical protein